MALQTENEHLRAALHLNENASSTNRSESKSKCQISINKNDLIKLRIKYKNLVRKIEQLHFVKLFRSKT